MILLPSRMAARSRALLLTGAAALMLSLPNASTYASSHREAPLISNDPVADNTDVYAFRSPDNPNTVTIIANYIPFELPEGGPNYYSFGEGVRYEIHVKNKLSTSGDDITYRFTFTQVNQDPTTFFNIRLGKQNLKTTYICEKSTNGGNSWTTVVGNGVVPPPNIGPRSIESVYGLNTTYSQLFESAKTTATTGERVFAGPVDDPFFVDLAGIFDLGGFRKDGKDGLAGFNCHTIAIQVPIEMLQKDGKPVSQATSILDADFVIGVWASASRPQITTLSSNGGKPTYSSNYVQVSRLGMPLTNEVIIPIGMKDRWNHDTPGGPDEMMFMKNFTNPELGLYVGNGLYSAAIPGLAAIKIDTNSLQMGFDFRNEHIGLYGLYATNAGAGTALDTNGYGKILLQPNAPRSVDILPIFLTGVPNLPPYQLATGKSGNPLAVGKPFINNFLPTLGDMLRLNMAVPVTDRNSVEFKLHAKEGLVRAAVLGLTDPTYANPTLQSIPNMDGFPNGRRLEDDVTTIEMQAVSGLVLNVLGLWTDDYVAGAANPVTPNLVAKISFTAGVSQNDVPFTTSFPFEAMPHEGAKGLQRTNSAVKTPPALGIAAPRGGFLGQNYPNPVVGDATSVRYYTAERAFVTITAFDVDGRSLGVLESRTVGAGNHDLNWDVKNLPSGTYVLTMSVDDAPVQSLRISRQK